MNIFILFCPILFFSLTYVVTLDSPDCPQGCEESVMCFPDEICHKFWRCFDGKAYQFLCPRGRQWNPVLDQCDLPEFAGCTGEGWRNITLECPSELTTTTTVKPVTLSNICDTQEDGTFLPHNDCGKFWKCDHGIAYLFDCPGGLHWNSDINNCDWPASAGCTSEN